MEKAVCNIKIERESQAGGGITFSEGIDCVYYFD